MSDELPAGCVGVLMGIIMGIFIGWWIGNYLGQEHHQKEAIRHGAAEYILNPDTGETKWQWKNQPKEGEDDESPKQN